MYLIISAVSFVVFVGLIFTGSVWGVSPIGDVGELIVLLCASVFFVAAMLRSENLAKSNN